ncbi:kanamycin kinase [Rhodococcus sp. 27YEA15]|uniref:phosphotransferase n=1 Tax=Rhodococcus sp. 27YEA15 TaxID=3156259 RepID=UPI003C7C426A
MTSAVPDLPLPDVVVELAGGEAIEPVWINGEGGITYRLGSGRYLKWHRGPAEVTLELEAHKIMWASSYLSVPAVLEVGHSGEESWLVTRAIVGDSAVSQRWLADPATAVRAVGRGLRDVHESVPVEECPWRWDPATRIESAAKRGIRAGDDLRRPPVIDRLVVCHGDACCPNTVLTEVGDVSGHLDLGSLGVADRWADIAVAAMSTLWNYGPGWESELVAAYGLPFDQARMDYYRRLWNAL